MNIIAGISISILATAITGIIVSTTTGSPKTGSMENTTIDYGTNGPNDSSGECPSPARWSTKNKECCCRPSCCFDKCTEYGQWSIPPEDCLQGVQNSKWIFNNNLGYYQAFQHTGLLGTVQYFFASWTRHETTNGTYFFDFAQQYLH